ncbi:MAG: hypothetical protein U0163_05190 [Gemmatimonadaceae bacterium]
MHLPHIVRRTRWLPKGQRVAIALSVALLLTAWRPLSPLVDASTGSTASGAHLRLGAGYLVLAPLCSTLDALSLLSVSQHIALVSWILAFLVLGVALARKVTWRTVLVRLVGGVAAVAAVYVVNALVPRPMAQLVLAHGSEMAVDFHSHTEASHDGRWGFGESDTRAWHRDAGFNVAYVTDHGSPGDRGVVFHNRALAGLDVVLLPGNEYRWDGAHVVSLAPNLATTPPVIWSAFTRISFGGPTPPRVENPLLVETLPVALERTRHSPLSVGALELSDASPKGLEQGRRDRERILRVADSLNIAVVASSNNHGWGRTAASWSVLDIPGWRELPPLALAGAIDHHLRTERRHAVRVVARRMIAPHETLLANLASVPAIVWSASRTLSPLERISWVLWLWLPALASGLRTRRRRAALQAPIDRRHQPA